MIDIQDIYNATNGGLDIILSYYPQAQKSVETGKPFCLRNERTPSAYLKQFGNQYKVTDFGERLAESPQVASLENIGTYDDGTGYYIFRLKTKHNRETLQSEVQSTFEEYFK